MRLIDAGEYEKALQMLRIESRKNPADLRIKASVELVEGLRALSAGDRLEAAQRFEATLDLDPSNERAAREIAEMRRHATNQRKGLLSKLMRKD
jgi:hypothetical protein